MLPLPVSRRLGFTVALALLGGPAASAFAHEAAHHRAEHRRHDHEHEAAIEHREGVGLWIGAADEAEVHQHTSVDPGLSSGCGHGLPALTTSGTPRLPAAQPAAGLRPDGRELSFSPPAHPPPTQPRAPPNS